MSAVGLGGRRPGLVGAAALGLCLWVPSLGGGRGARALRACGGGSNGASFGTCVGECFFRIARHCCYRVANIAIWTARGKG